MSNLHQSADQWGTWLTLCLTLQRLVGMGLSQVSVKEALKLRLEARGFICRTVTEALELVFDYEEDQRKRNAVNSVCHDGPHGPAQVIFFLLINCEVVYIYNIIFSYQLSINPFCNINIHPISSRFVSMKWKIFWGLLTVY